MFSRTSHLPQEEAGQGLTEYSLILSLVAIVVIMAVAFFGEGVASQYCNIISELSFSSVESSNCNAPTSRLIVIDQGPNYINIEADVNDPDGDPDDPYGAISKVEFYIDSTAGGPVQTEYIYRYCLSGNPIGAPCGNFDISGLSPGQHTVIVMTYDIDGNVSSSQITFSK